MSVLVVGVSHKTAPVAMLEQLALEESGVAKLAADAVECEYVAEAAVIATCNRVEIYAEVDRFHGSVEDLSRLLAERTGQPAEALLPHLYVHYDDGAVSHLFHVAAGLDSMVLGEGQILGQARDALRVGQHHGTVGPSLNLLFQQALRVGKRSHAETDIDHAAPSLVTAGLDQVVIATGPIAGRRVLVLGAGSMAALAVAAAARLGAAEITVVNRTAGNADRLAAEYGARSADWADRGPMIARSDVVVSCTGATDVVLTREQLTAARAEQPTGTEHTLAIVDLALPHDVEPSVADLPGVVLIDLARLAEELRDSDAGREVQGARAIVEEELGAYLAARRQASVTPTVVALRSMATEVVEAEMTRLESRLPDLDDATRAALRQSVRRVADKLLHQPTVRVKELADQGGTVSYAAALAELFALDPDAVEAVTRPEVRP